MHPALVVLAVGLLVAVVVGSVYAFRRHQLEVRKLDATEAQERARREREEKRLREERAAAGTHLEDGRLKCRIEGCDQPAVADREHVVRDELSFRAWVRRRFGAPRRWGAEMGKSLEYCAPCAVLGSQVVEHGVSQATECVSNVVLEQDAALAHLESHGVDARVAELRAEQRQRSVPPPSKVQPVRRVGT